MKQILTKGYIKKFAAKKRLMSMLYVQNQLAKKKVQTNVASGVMMLKKDMIVV